MIVTVYTALYGDSPDKLHEPPPGPFPHARYVAFTDRSPEECPGWEVRPGVKTERELTPRRRARYYKCLPHIVLPDAPATIWVDATHRPLVCMNTYGESVTGNWTYSFATYKHAERVCIYQEGRACLALKKDDPALIERQLARYETEGYPYYHGLCETSVVVRKNRPAVRTLNELWWQEIRDNSLRDQLSLPYVLWKLRQDYQRLPGRAHIDPKGFEFKQHWQPCASAST